MVLGSWLFLPEAHRKCQKTAFCQLSWGSGSPHDWVHRRARFREVFLVQGSWQTQRRKAPLQKINWASAEHLSTPFLCQSTPSWKEATSYSGEQAAHPPAQAPSSPTPLHMLQSTRPVSEPQTRAWQEPSPAQVSRRCPCSHRQSPRCPQPAHARLTPETQLRITDRNPPYSGRLLFWVFKHTFYCSED